MQAIWKGSGKKLVPVFGHLAAELGDYATPRVHFQQVLRKLAACIAQPDAVVYCPFSRPAWPGPKQAVRDLCGKSKFNMSENRGLF